MAKMSASEEKMLMLQHHMRENNMDLESFVKDMNKWEDDIKEKEKKLKSEKSLKEKVCRKKGFLTWLMLYNTYFPYKNVR